MNARALGALTAIFSLFVSALVVGLAGPAAAVATDQSYWVPVSKSVTVQGHGYGHGRGMSQHGAQGAALQGKTYRQIMDFYYPGTSWGTMRGPVRVLITADTTSDVLVSPVDGLRVRDLGNDKVHPLPEIEGVRRWRLNVDDGRTVVAYLTNRWRRYKPEGRSSLVGDGEFRASRPITLWTPSGATTYRGKLRAASPYPGSSQRDTVNVVSMNTYVKGVVPHEMPASWHLEAVKSQSIAARTYATWSRNQNRDRYYQICDTTACQVYGGADAEDPRANAAVGATGREILRYDGDPAFTQFSASSGGWTSQGSTPYLPAKKDPYDRWAGNYVHDWSTTIDTGHFERAYPRLGTLRRIQVVNRDGNGQWRGRVNTVVLHGSDDTVTVSGDDFRWAFGLRSNWFTIDPTPIIARWNQIGGASSRLGPVRAAEYSSGPGAVQRFERGRIYHSESTGAHEVYGPVLGKYRSLGGPGSELGFPTSPVQRVERGVQVTFQHGTIFRNREYGAVELERRISKRYTYYGGVSSELGWPTRGNYDTPRGERADFVGGSILWFQDTNRVRVRLK